MRRTRARSVQDEVDLVVLELIRLASREEWTAPAAATALLTKRYRRGALRLALAGVIEAQLERDSRIADRSARTLRAALGFSDAGVDDGSDSVVEENRRARVPMATAVA